jgi:hypothetical protein
MARYAANAQTTLELPASACVCAHLAAGALTKGGHTDRRGPSATRNYSLASAGK